MNRTRRMALWAALLAVLLGAAALWAHGRLRTARQLKLAAEADLVRCRQLARSLERLGDAPARAGQSERQAAELVRQIEAAAAKAGLPAEGIVRIWRDPPRRAGESVYKEQATQVLLARVTIRQLAGLVHELTADGGYLSAKSIRLSAPRGAEDSEFWTAEVVFVYYLYDPPAAGRG